MSDWNPNHYLEFANERTRPAADLVARIHIAQPQSIVDLGCGPGNSTQVLRQRWPDARIVGIDPSPEMIKAARSSFPDQAWKLADAAQWSCPEPVSLVFSNALFQWIPDHQQLVQRLWF
jgi:trans-aconitate 2-methyltransferase